MSKSYRFFLAIGSIVLITVLILYFYTPLSTMAARYAWERYRAGSLAIALDRSDADLAMLIGNYHFNAVIGGGTYDPDVAQKAYAKAVAINPEILWGHYGLARVYFVQGDFEAALREIDAELAAHPANLRSLYIRGLIYGNRNSPGDLARAEADFKRFIAWAPKEWGGYNDLAWTLSREGKNQEVVRIISSAFESVPHAKENPWLWNSLGVARLALGDYPEATLAFERAKTFVSGLKAEDWRRAYPGNDPRQDESGLVAFQNAVDENLFRATDMHSAR